MDILNSEWLIHMLKKSSPTPHGRLLSLFEILEDWLNAPIIAEQLPINITAQTKLHQLQDYLTIEAAKAGAAMPEILASQLYFMAIAAAQEKLQASKQVNLSQTNLSLASFSHAKNAAHALISAQTKKEFYITKTPAYALAASFAGVLLVVGSMFFLHDNQSKSVQSGPQDRQVAPMKLPSLANPMLASATLTASPEQTALLMAQIELMRHGNCQLIEAIQLPDKLKGIYLNMVVNGEVSTDPQEQKIAMELIKRTRCNYTPMLMANSK